MKYLLVLIFLTAELYSIDSATLLSQFEIDPEHEIPDDELELLEEILRNCTRLDSACIGELVQLSFISSNELYMLIEPELPAAAPLQSNDGLPPTLQINLRQMNVFSSDVRYRWQTRINYNSVVAGFQAERDPYEKNITDFKSGYLSGNWNSIQWIAGDHQILAGFGLNLWRSSPAYKGFDSGSAIKRPGKGLDVYRSSTESWGLRGIAAQSITESARILVSLSNNYHDGDPGSIPVINTSGLHTTSGSEASADQLLEKAICTAGEIYFGRSRAGFTAVRSNWYSKQEYHTQYNAFSFFFKSTFESADLFCELARGYDNKTGLLCGASIKESNVKYALSGRLYENGYLGFRSNPLAEWSGAEKNEAGLMQSVSIKQGNHQFTAYGDIYRQSGTDGAKAGLLRGSETGLRWEHSTRKHKIRFQARWNMRSEEEIVYFSDEISSVNTNGDSYKILYTRSVGNQLYYKLQFNCSVDPDNNLQSPGLGSVSMITWKLPHLQFSLDWVWVNIPTYDRRLYFWDHNLPGEMRSRVYTTTGNYPGIKILWTRDKTYRMGLRIRRLSAKYAYNYEGALFIETNI